MAAYKNKDNGTWYVQFRYTDWKGERQQKLKRGFSTKKEALEWEREFLFQKQSDISMTFESFYQLYEKDTRPKLKLNTWINKDRVVQNKILPYFGKRKLSDITPKDVMDWQNVLRAEMGRGDKPHAQGYLRTIHGQLSSIFNHAVRYYGLRENPARKAGGMGPEAQPEMRFWTKNEYLKFAEVMMDNPMYYYAFEMLYWCGLRSGEMQALTPSDFDLDAGTVSITKSYQRIHRQDIITSPKTKKSVRVVKMPQFLCDEIRDYLKMYYSNCPNDRIFPVTKQGLKYQLETGSEKAGVKKIRVHDIRHSHVSLLIDMGFTALAIADRVGHESINITYRYAHLFPNRQDEMAQKLNMDRMKKGD